MHLNKKSYFYGRLRIYKIDGFGVAKKGAYV